MPTEIDVAGVAAGYGRVEVLHDLTFAVTGSVIGLLGPNGAGKTTLLSVVTGARQPTHGQVRIGGAPVDRTQLGTCRRGCDRRAATSVATFCGTWRGYVRCRRPTSTAAYGRRWSRSV